MSLLNSIRRIMSWSEEMADRHDLSMSQAFTLDALCEHADEQWSCYPAIETLARKTRQSYRTVQRRLDELEEKTLIRRERLHSATGQNAGYRFYILGGPNDEREVNAPENQHDKPSGWEAQPDNQHDNGVRSERDSPPKTPASTRARAKKPLTPAPPEWSEPERLMPQAYLEAALKKGLNPVEARHEFERFVDHHVSLGHLFADWLAAFRKWLANAVKWAAERAKSPPRRSGPQDPFADYMRDYGLSEEDVFGYARPA